MDNRGSASSAAEGVAALVRSVPFFGGLDRIDTARLVGALEKVHLPAGILIFAEGADADSLYLLEAGRVQVTVKDDRGEQPVAVVEAPGYFGELGLLLARRTGSVRALTDVDVWTLPRRRFEQVVRERATVGIAVAASLAGLIEDRSRAHAGAAAAPKGPAVAAPPALPRREGRPSRSCCSGLSSRPAASCCLASRRTFCSALR